MAHYHRRSEWEEQLPQQSPYDLPQQAPYGDPSYGGGYPAYEQHVEQHQQQQFPSSPMGYGHATDYNDRREDEVSRFRDEEKRHKKEEHLGATAGLGGTAFGMYEGHEVKADPSHARRHKIEEEVSQVGGVGSGGYGLYEHHQVKEGGHRVEEIEGKKNKHWF